MKNKNTHFILALIIIFSFLVRVFRLGENPNGFFCDEASIGFNAYSVLTRGADEHDVKFPLFFKAFGEFKSPVQIYSTVLLIFVFGLNEFSTRATSAIYGTLSVFTLFFLTKELLRNSPLQSKTALFASFMLAISPWHIHFSRIAFEMMPFVFFTILGVYFLLKYVHKYSYKNLIFTTISFVLAIYSYFPARIFIPFYSLFLFIIYFPRLIKFKTHLLAAVFVGFIILFPFFRFMLTPNGWSRFKEVSVFSHPPQNRSISSHITQNYLSHFSFDFLFKKGDAGANFITRHSLKNFGELYLFQLPLLFLGLIYFISQKKFRGFLLVFFWLLLYPTGSMLTAESWPQATRSIIGVVPFQIISACGLNFLVTKTFSTRRMRSHTARAILILFATMLVFLFSFYQYLFLFYKDYPLYSSGYWGWQYGVKPALAIVNKEEEDYDQVLFTHRFNMIHILLKFYNITYNCQRCSVATNPISIDPNKRQLFVLRADDIGQAKELYPDLNFKVKEKIYLPNNTADLFIGEFRPFW